MFAWDAGEEWAYIGKVGAIPGPPGPPGPPGDAGADATPGKPGTNGLNGAHGSAYAKQTATMPAAGEVGRLYLYTEDMSLYVTTRE